MNAFKIIVPTLLLLAGCASYQWRPQVPRDLRTVSISVFRNESDTPEMGAISTRQIAREFQREGTFKLVSNEDAMIEIQGIVTMENKSVAAQRRRDGEYALTAYNLFITAKISVIDHKNGRVLIDNRTYKGEAPFTARESVMNSQRDAIPRAAEDLARQIVDDVLNLKW